MVYIGPDVQVIEDYDEPVFYSANVYWRYNGGIWYQSRTYTGGWVTVSTPPPAIVRIQTPTMYVHYRASAHAEANAQGNGRAAEVQQEHRQEQADKREEKREDKQVREEVKEQKQEQKREEKREEKQDKHDDKQDKHDNGKHK